MLLPGALRAICTAPCLTNHIACLLSRPPTWPPLYLHSFTQQNLLLNLPQLYCVLPE